MRLRSHSALLPLLLVAVLAPPTAAAQSARDLRRAGANSSTAVTESQEAELTLTVGTVELRPIQVWVRAGAVTEADGRLLVGIVSAIEGARIAPGQRVRAFTPDSRSSMYQARVTKVAHDSARTRIEARLTGPGRDGARRYVMEIVTETADLLTIPNEAIIETGMGQLVYIQEEQGRYSPRDVRIGVQGELYSEVLEGLASGERVVTFGSFFIDAEHKLKGS